MWRREKRQSGNAADYSRKPRVGNGAPTRFPFGRETATTATSTRTATATFDRRQRPRNAIGCLCDGWQRAFFFSVSVYCNATRIDHWRRSFFFCSVPSFRVGIRASRRAQGRGWLLLGRCVSDVVSIGQRSGTEFRSLAAAGGCFPHENVGRRAQLRQPAVGGGGPGVRLLPGGPDCQQQAAYQYADHPGGGECRTRSRHHQSYREAS